MYETVLRRRDGRKVYVELNAGIITYQGKPADLVIVRDITERKRAEEKIKEQLDELQRWYDVMLDREDRTLQVKHEVNELLRRLGEPIRYPSAET